MKNVVPLCSFALIASISSTSFADYFQVFYHRCAVDLLHGHPSQQAWNPEGRTAYDRTTWARAAYDWHMHGPNPNPSYAQRFWHSSLDFEVEQAANLYDIDLYPVYVDLTNSMSVWVGPGPNNNSVWHGTTFSTIKDRPYSLPGGAAVAGLCGAACYTPEQKVRFGDTFTAIAEAYELGQRKVTTLAPNATFGAVNFITNDIARWTVDTAPSAQTIITLRMESGGELRVTPEHPILTSEGVMKKVRHLVVGESLVREDGSTDPIASMEQTTAFTKVYNLRPATTDLTSNILVAQGYLNGSTRYQSELVKYLNRVLLRRNIPAALIRRSS